MFSYDDAVSAIIAKLDAELGPDAWEDGSNATSVATQNMLEVIFGEMLEYGTFWPFIQNMPAVPEGFDSRDVFENLVELNKDLAYWAIVNEMARRLDA